MSADFINDIACMNVTFETGYNKDPVSVPHCRVVSFHNILKEEVAELLEATECDSEIDSIVKYADTLGDIVVYCFSEAARFGIPMGEVLSIIMDSMNSKLVDGKPLWNDDHSKFIKGPGFIPPESAIRQMLLDQGFPS